MNRYFRDVKYNFGRASSVHASLCCLQWGNATLRFALAKATEDDTFLSTRLVEGILFLNELVKKASTNGKAAC